MMDASYHSVHFEGGGAGGIAGVVLKLLNSENGIYSGEQLAQSIAPSTPYYAQSKMAVIESPTNLGGGRIWSPSQIDAVCEVAHQKRMKVHLDGARIFNAIVETGIGLCEYTKNVDSFWLDFSKGLGAPVGSILIGSKDFIEQARRFRLRLGGSMRKPGVMASAALYALENNVERLKEDNDNAKMMANDLANIDGVVVKYPVETNIIYLEVSDAKQICDELSRFGFRFLALSDNLIRSHFITP